MGTWNRFHGPLFLFGFVLLVVLACRLTQEDKVDHTLSFDSLYDSLSGYDSVQIQLKDTDGNFLGLIFHGKVTSEDSLKSLPAPNYDGKGAIISITGFSGGESVYRADRIFDGTNNETRNIIVLLSPATSMEADSGSLRIFEGDTMPLPKIVVFPAELANKTLLWTCLDPQLLTLGDSSMVGKARGNAKVLVKLKSNPLKEIILLVSVVPNPSVPDSLFLSPETLFVAAKGASKKLKTAFIPITAKPTLTWHSSEGAIAIVSEAGEVYGVNKGLARVWAVSRIKSGVSDSVWVSVSERIPVTGIRFTDDSLNLFIGGSTEPLVTTVTPNQANPEMDFLLRDKSKVELTGDGIKGISTGGTWVVAVSRDNSTLMDSIRVEVLGTQQVDSVVVSPPFFQLYTGGKDFALTGNVYPATAYAKVQWKSLDLLTATVDPFGRVSPVAPGVARVVATSLADSLRKDTSEAIVKQDIPELRIGRDTTITQGQTLTFSPEVSQDYGGIASFKWDVDGEHGWDDSSTTLSSVAFKYLKEKAYPVQFYVRDGEGNVDTVQYHVNVNSAPMLVVITSPGRDTLVNTPLLTIRYTVNEIDLSVIVNLHHGENLILIDTSDEKGSGRDSIRITLDTNAPVITIKTPLPNQTFNKDSIEVQWSIDGSPQSDKNMEFLGTTDGKKDVTREFTDKAGNKGLTTVSVYRDTRPPKIAIISPKDSSITGSGVIRVVWYADSIIQTSDTTAILVDGPNTITRKSIDAAGNIDSSSISVTYLSKAPVVKILSPLDSTVTDKKTIVVSWNVNGVASKSDTLQELIEGPNRIGRTAIDAVGQKGSDSVTVIFNPKVPNVQISSPVSGTVTNRTSVPVAWTINGVAQAVQLDSLPNEGENTLIRRFKDSLGYEGVATIHIIRDTRNPLPPVVNAVNSLITSANQASATWNWQSGGDAVGGAGMKTPKAYRYQLDNQPAVETSLESFTLASPTDGVHSLIVQEQDKAGNWSVYTSIVTITVDKTPPASPEVSGESPSSDPAWMWKTLGGGSGNFRYRLDNGPYSAATKTKRYNPSTISDVDHTLYVQEQDEHGNWSSDGFFTIAADLNPPTVPFTASLACMEPGSPSDTVVAEMDSEGYRRIFDGKTFKGWWSNCKTPHSNGSTTTGAIFTVDQNSKSFLTTQNGSSTGGILMTNKVYSNYEIVMDIWPSYGNDAGIFHRSPANGRCYQTNIDYISNASVGGVWGEGGFASRDFRPFYFNGSGSSIRIPGNGNGELSNWTTITSKLKATTEPNLPCPSAGCTQSDWQTLWDMNGWNEFRVQYYGGSVSGTGNIHMKSWFRKSGASTWVPLLQDTTLAIIDTAGYIGLQVHGGGRFGGAPGTWYRNIKLRELTDLGEPLNPP